MIQRVSSASVAVEGEATGSIGAGLLVLLGIGPEDTEAEALWMVNKLVNLRIFADEAGQMNLSLLDREGGVLVVSQFTLYGDCRRGRRPSFKGAAHPSLAEPLYERFCELLEERKVFVQRGIFAADMKVSLVNDGPVTLVLDRGAGSS